MQVSNCMQREGMMEMFWKELKAVLKNRLIIGGLIIAVFIPTLYSATFLWAFWDPYDYTENLKVAVVNEDEPVFLRGEKLYYGRQITEQLRSNKDLEWQFVDKKKAIDGLEDNTYSMMIEIPEDFSQKVSSVFTNDAEQPVIYHVPNEAKNYMISMIQNGMVQQLKSNISNTLTEKYIEVLVQSIKQIENEIDQMKGSMNELSEELGTLRAPLDESIETNSE